MPFISICIPAYKHVDYLKRLLDSIGRQRYKDFEIVITDDSPGDEVEILSENYKPNLDIYYYKNDKPLGTPENWNEAIRQAKGTWIKMMHNDDWFASENALQLFYEAVQKNPDAVFFFSAFQNIEVATGRKQVVKLSLADKFFLKSNPYHLLKKVYIGNPSCTLIKKDLQIFYDNRYKFIVDFEYYIRVIQQNVPPVYIDEVLLNIGFHDEQVTSYTKYNPEVQLQENITFLNEQKTNIFKNIVVYDYFWRLMRNNSIRTVDQLKSYVNGEAIKSEISSLVRFQSKIPSGLLKIGLISKLLMLVSYLKSKLDER